MTAEELKRYAEQYRQNFGEPINLKCNSLESIPNALNTSNRHAWGGISWINYWRALTGHYENALFCARCGKRIFADIESNECKDYVKQHNLSNYPKLQITVEALQAIGGHILNKTGEEYFEGYYIIPLCIDHNNEHCNIQTIQKDTLMCAEIGATID